MFWGRVVIDLMQPGEELKFYRKSILDLTQRGLKPSRRVYWRLLGIPEIFIFIWYVVTYYDTNSWSCGTLYELFIELPSRYDFYNNDILNIIIPVIYYKFIFSFPVPCEAGHFSSTGFKPCHPCPQNFFAASTGSTECDECGQESFTTSVGQTQCEEDKGK